MRALEGIRVLDLSRFIPGVLGSMMLADMGADVIVVEEPIRPGSKAMAGPGGRDPYASPEELAANPLYRNKRRIELDLKTAEGREVFYRLARTADVVLEGFRPGVMKRLGVDHGTLEALNPRIISCAITGYGQSGPYVDLPGHDINYIAITGVLDLIGQKGGPPTVPLNLVGDYGGGTYAAIIGILMALVAREKTGRGQYVDISMSDGVAGLMTTIIGGHFGTGRVPERGNDTLTGARAWYGPYQAKDGKYVAIGCAEPWFWANLCRAMGREDFIAHQNDPTKQEEMFADLRAKFLTKTRDEWFDELSAKEVCVSKVLSLDEVHTDPQLQHRQMVVTMRSPAGREVQHVGLPFKLSDTPGELRTTAASRGAHTREILKSELGLSEADLARLEAAGAIPVRAPALVG